MNVYEIKPSNVGFVAELMARIKPEWWDYDDAVNQLQNVHTLAELRGWYLGSSAENPCGWVLCAGFDGYSCMSIECLGFDNNGEFVMEEQLSPIILQAEAFAKKKGYRNLKYIIGSTALSCHNRPITDYAEELKNLQSYGRKHFDYMKSIGFVPTGFIPNCYGKYYHGIIMIKDLTI